MRQAAEQAAEALREEILSGALSSGTRLGEMELATRLAVSRTPIREALSRLAAEGLVELQPNRGARVASWSASELREIFDIRLALEPLAVRQAVERLTTADRVELDDLARAMRRAGRPGRSQDLGRVFELNRRFHSLLIDAAGNAALASALRAVTHAAVVSQNFHDYSPEALQRSLLHHEEIVAAAGVGDGLWADAVMRAHLFNARTTMLPTGPLPTDPLPTDPLPTDGATPGARPGTDGQRSSDVRDETEDEQ
ncbi:MAG: GntR family transcriptional regulator, partial [Actinomycetes bacterium]